MKYKGEIKQSIREVSEAMERLILSFERRIEDLGTSKANAEELQRLTKGIHAVRDSAGIYLSWAKHYAKLVDEGEGEMVEDLEDFLNEGGGTNGNLLFGP
jgi:hypothetical protein